MIAHQQSDIYLIFINSVHQPHSPDVKYLSHNKNMHPQPYNTPCEVYISITRKIYMCHPHCFVSIFRQLNIF